MTQNNAKTNVPPVFVAGGDLAGNLTNQTVIGLQGRSIWNQPPADGYVLTWSSLHNRWQAAPPRVSGSRRVVTHISGTYTISSTNDDYIIIDTAASSFTITLPSAPIIGDWYEIKDMSGNIGLNNITIYGGTIQIDAPATFNFIMSQPYENVKFTFNGAAWSVG